MIKIWLILSYISAGEPINERVWTFAYEAACLRVLTEQPLGPEERAAYDKLRVSRALAGRTVQASCRPVQEIER